MAGTRTRRAAWTSAIVRASHPGPCLAIATLTTALAVAAGARGGGRIILIFLAVLTGQLSVGWSNDAFDARRDVAARRRDKPIVTGTVDRATVAWAGAAALVGCVPLSLGLGWRPAGFNLLVVAAGWVYNAGVKATGFSALAYAVGFGLIPALAAAAAGGPFPPWSVAAGAMVGVGGHFTNVLVDLEQDLSVGVLGLPQRIAVWTGGQLAVRLLAVALLLGASAVAALAPGPRNLPALLVGFAVAVGLAVGAVVTPGRLPFRLAIGMAAVDVAMLLVRGRSGLP